MFFFVGEMLGDSGLVSIRQQHLTSNVNRKNVTIYDMLYYPFDGIKDAAELPLDYHMDGIDAFVSRSSWEAGAMYTGLMGGLNNVNHGQIDSGNFIYHNKGIVWFMDLGSEQYNAYGYFGSSRNNYYRSNAEGQNVVCLVSDPENLAYGQYSGAGGDITATYVNEHGSYAHLDNTSVYLDKAVLCAAPKEKFGHLLAFLCVSFGKGENVVVASFKRARAIYVEAEISLPFLKGVGSVLSGYIKRARQRDAAAESLGIGHCKLYRSVSAH
jgi:hypothetical protein